MLFLHELIRSIKYMQQKLIFSEISNNCHLRWLLNEHNKPSVFMLVMLCVIYSSAHIIICMHVFTSSFSIFRVARRD